MSPTPAQSTPRGVKTTVELPPEVWRAAKIRAMDDYTDLRSIVVAALNSYLELAPVQRSHGKPGTRPR